jgi:hypothetical protein
MNYNQFVEMLHGLSEDHLAAIWLGMVHERATAEENLHTKVAWIVNLCAMNEAWGGVSQQFAENQVPAPALMLAGMLMNNMGETMQGLVRHVVWASSPERGAPEGEGGYRMRAVGILAAAFNFIRIYLPDGPLTFEQEPNLDGVLLQMLEANAAALHAEAHPNFPEPAAEPAPEAEAEAELPRGPGSPSTNRFLEGMAEMLNDQESDVITKATRVILKLYSVYKVDDLVQDMGDLKDVIMLNYTEQVVDDALMQFVRRCRNVLAEPVVNTRGEHNGMCLCVMFVGASWIKNTFVERWDQLGLNLEDDFDGEGGEAIRLNNLRALRKELARLVLAVHMPGITVDEDALLNLQLRAPQQQEQEPPPQQQEPPQEEQEPAPAAPKAKAQPKAAPKAKAKSQARHQDNNVWVDYQKGLVITRAGIAADAERDALTDAQWQRLKDYLNHAASTWGNFAPGPDPDNQANFEDSINVEWQHIMETVLYED